MENYPEVNEIYKIMFLGKINFNYFLLGKFHSDTFNDTAQRNQCQRE